MLVGGSADRQRPGILSLAGGAERVRQVVSHQLRLRRRRALPSWDAPVGWSLETGDDDGRPSAARDALFALADGRVGTGGPPLAGSHADHVWTVANAVYDGTGPATHLLPGPVPFALGTAEPDRPVVRLLDLRTGVAARAQRLRRLGRRERPLPVPRPTDHRRRAGLRPRRPSHRTSGSRSPARAAATNRGSCPGRAGSPCRPPPVASSPPVSSRGRRSRGSMDRTARAGRWSTGWWPCARRSGLVPEVADVVDDATVAAAVGFDNLLAEHRRAWARRWEDADVVVEGDDELQRAIRFSLFHLMGSVADTGEAAVGREGPHRDRVQRTRVLGRRRLRASLPGGHASGIGPGDARVPSAPAAGRGGCGAGPRVGRGPASRGSPPTRERT